MEGGIFLSTCRVNDLPVGELGDASDVFSGRMDAALRFAKMNLLPNDEVTF
jgi:hypothetical protein